MSQKVVKFKSAQQAELLRFALDYAKIGWHILPIFWIKEDGNCACGKFDCHSKGKHPIGSLVQNGFKDGTTNFDTIRSWLNAYPQANLAVALYPSRLVAFDVDPRNGGFETFEMLEAKHGRIASNVHQFTGGGGFHLFFDLPQGITNLPATLGKGIDLKLNGYVLIEPSNHASGGVYEWEGSSSPIDGNIADPLPAWICDLAFKRESVVVQDGFVSRLVTPEQLTDLKAALAFVDAEDYDCWIRIGQALKSCGAAGFALWNDYSAKSDKYNAEVVARKWNTFKPTSIDYKTVFFEAQKNGFHNVPTAPEFISLMSEIQLYQKPASNSDALPKLTGILGVIEDYYNETAPIANPIFAKQCAIGIVSVLLGRRFKTKYRHLSSLYLACIGLSGAGKDHVKSTTNLILKEIGKINLLGGNGYTSSGAVISTLAKNPVHLTVIDELGYYLKECQGNNASHRRGAVSMLMQCITSLDSHVNSESYSRMGDLIMNKGSEENSTSHQTIEQPAISLIGLTTPSTFFEALTLEMIKDGFYGRFLTVHSNQEPKPVSLRGIKTIALPKSIQEFSDSISARHSELGNLSALSEVNSGSVEQVELDIDDAAIDLLDEFATEMTAMQKELATHGFESLVNRSAEFACRLALIFELSNNVHSLSVTKESAALAISYVRVITIENVSVVKNKITGNFYEREKIEVLEAIRKHGKNGITNSEMGRKAPFSKHKGRDLQEIINALVNAELIALVNTREGKAGSARNAYIALDVSTLS